MRDPEGDSRNIRVTSTTPITVEVSSSNKTKNIFSIIKSAGLSAFEAGSTVLYTAKALKGHIPSIPEKMAKNLEEIKASKPTATEAPTAKKRKSRKKSGGSSPSPKEIEKKTNKARQEGKQEGIKESQTTIEQERERASKAEKTAQKAIREKNQANADLEEEKQKNQYLQAKVDEEYERIISTEKETEKAIREKEELNQALQTERNARDEERKEWEEEAKRILEGNKQIAEALRIELDKKIRNHKLKMAAAFVLGGVTFAVATLGGVAYEQHNGNFLPVEVKDLFVNTKNLQVINK